MGSHFDCQVFNIDGCVIKILKHISMKRVLIVFFSTILFGQLNAQNNIEEARAQSIGSTVTVTGIVTNGSELGSIRYMQDTTAGIAAYSSSLSNVKRGDSITVTGVLKSYNNLLEIDPVSDFTVHSSNNSLPEPQLVTPNQLSEDNEAELVLMKDVEFDNAGSAFAGNTSYTLSYGEQTTTVYVKTGSPLVGKIIPSGLVKVIGICSQYSYDDPNSGYQLIIRDIDDIQNNSSIYLTSPININKITTDTLMLSWTTNIAGDSYLMYGNTEFLELGTVFSGSNTIFHQASLTTLQPSELIYAKAMVTDGADTAYSSTGVFITQSVSTGCIKTYFNTAVDNSVSTGVDAITLYLAVDDTLIQYINRAESTIDMAIYNINNYGINNISTALNNAYNRGVNIRIVHDGSTECAGLDELDEGINTIASPTGSEYGIMHNKFIIFDADLDDANKPLVWTGSTNLTLGNITEDANNVIIIQDKSLATAYKLEFEEMWGSTTLVPNPEKAKFGADKKDNVPHIFIMDGYSVQLYFSPTDQTNKHLVDAIYSANYDLNIETMLITRSDIAYAIEAAHQGGAATSVITNSEGENSSFVNQRLTDELGNYFVFDNEVDGMLHNKIMIVDQGNPDADPLVLTGSHNWSNAANNKNDENTLIIHDATIANIYYQQFYKRFTQNGGGVSIKSNKNLKKESLFSIYPNPNSGSFTLAFNKNLKGAATVKLFDIYGRVVYKELINERINKHNISLNKAIAKGCYFLQVINNGNTYTQKIVVD